MRYIQSPKFIWRRHNRSHGHTTGRSGRVVLNGLLLLVMAAAGYSTALMVRQARLVYSQERSTAKKVEELIKKKQELEQYLARLQTREGIEREAKERLNLKKIGEEVVVVVPEPEKESGAVPPPSGLWRKIADFLKRVLK